jgi:hypothetical protein
LVKTHVANSKILVATPDDTGKISLANYVAAHV